MKKKAKKVRKRSNSRRERDKYRALNPIYTLKTRVDLIDADYLDKLTPKEKDWLNKFTEEYTHANLDVDDLENNLHNTQVLKKDCFDRNNARNRCIYTQQKAMGNLNYIEDLDENILKDGTEDEIIEKLDKNDENLLEEELKSAKNKPENTRKR